MAITLDQFVTQVADSSLMSAAEVHALVAALPEDRRPRDGEQLAGELVRQKKLTAYQAQQIYVGKGKSLVFGEYRVLDKLGQGVMGVVLKAEHRRMKRLVAVKTIAGAALKSPDAERRFYRELEAAAKLEHPNIVTAHDASEHQGVHYLVMQLVDGKDLSAIVKENGPLPVAQAVECIVQAARGLEYAHKRGVVHRDIKPSNLLLDGDGAVKILDMGLARLESAGAEQDQLTSTGQIMGTVDYMAPEQAMNTKHADARADVYSLGIALWYLLAPRAVYDGETVVEKLMAHQTQPIPSLREACPEVSSELEAVFAKMLAELQEAWAKFLGVQVEMTNSIGMRFVLIPPGEFDMGSTEAEVAKLLEQAKATKQPQWYIDRLPSEAAKHRVRITKPFWLARHEVARGQFRRFVDDRGYQTEAERDGNGGYGLVDGQWKQDPRFVWNRDLGFEQADDHPVANLTWNDVTAFCEWLSEKEGEKSHLPSEAQWEYACRAGTTTKWYSGDDEGALKEHAWLSFNSDKKSHPVGQKSSNPWGLYDMHGNVWEWCQDWFGERY